MHNDIERRHRPTAWTVFGVGAAILAGDALLALAQACCSRTATRRARRWADQPALATSASLAPGPLAPDRPDHMQSTVHLNNQAERTIRPVKVQQRSSGGCWRTLQGLADYAVVHSYLSTAAKWGISTLHALRDLFNGRPWMPPGLEPAG